jgi:hypothetical protein
MSSRVYQKTQGRKSEELWCAHSQQTVVQERVSGVDADTNIDGIMIHLLAHTNEHLGQSVAYAWMNGIVPPWSE